MCAQQIMNITLLSIIKNHKRNWRVKEQALNDKLNKLDRFISNIILSLYLL